MYFFFHLWWWMSVLLAFGRQKQKDQAFKIISQPHMSFKVSLGYKKALSQKNLS